MGVGDAAGHSPPHRVGGYAYLSHTGTESLFGVYYGLWPEERGEAHVEECVEGPTHGNGDDGSEENR